MAQKVGDPVKRMKPLFEISTDKVDAEIPAPAAGVLARSRYRKGDSPCADAVAILETERGRRRPAPAKPEHRKRAGPAPAPASPPPAPKPSQQPLGPSTAARAVRPSADGDAGVQTASSGSDQVTPLVRKIAADTESISRGFRCGYAGRVTKQDILGYHRTCANRSGPWPESPALAPGSSAPGQRVVAGDRVEPWSKIADHRRPHGESKRVSRTSQLLRVISPASRSSAPKPRRGRRSSPTS